MGYSIFWNDMDYKGSVSQSGVGNSYETIREAAIALEDMANLLNQIGMFVRYEQDGQTWDGDDLRKVSEFWNHPRVGIQVSVMFTPGSGWRNLWIDSDEVRMVQESAHLFRRNEQT